MHFKLSEEIILLSNSSTWEFAKLEWDFEFAYYADELQTCLCGHYPIKNICVIQNKKNSNQTEVGNCCINKFLGIEDGNKIFTSIKKLKEDISKSMGAEVLDYLYNKNAISDFEYKFYKNIHRKRNLTLNQLEVKKRINNKLLTFTSYESNSHFNRIKIVLKWAENNTWFDKKFVLSLRSSCEKFGKLTDNQKIALESIITKLKIE